jgi:hypothetical protein
MGTTMQRMNFTFSECEHEGDLASYVGDLVACGATVLSSRVCLDAETGHVAVEVADKAAFLAKFYRTDACGFSNLWASHQP